jgi:plasmid replication initiation protein
MSSDEKTLVVRQSNELVEASYKIATVGEGRLIRMLIAQIQPDDEDFKNYRIGVADFARFFGLFTGTVNSH